MTVLPPNSVLWQDTFARADATGLANVGQNGETWEVFDRDGGTLDANITNNRFMPVRVSGGNIYTRYTTIGNGAIPDDCAVEVVVTYERRHDDFFGIVARWDGTNGVKVFFDGAINPSRLVIGDAANYLLGDTTPTVYSFPASWDDPGDLTMRIELQGANVEVYADGTLIASGTTIINTGGALNGRAVGFCGEVDASMVPGSGIPWAAVIVRTLP